MSNKVSSEIKSGGGEAGADCADALAHARSVLESRPSVDSWEVYLEEENSLTIEARDGEVESLVSARSMGMSVRVVSGGKLGFSFTNDLFPEAVERMVGRALEASRYMSNDSIPEFPAPPEGNQWPRLAIHDDKPASVPREDKVALAMEIESRALAFDPRVKRVRAAEYDELLSRVWIVNSAGLEARAAVTLVSASVEVVAEEKGEAQAAQEFETVHYYDMLNVARVGEEAARQAVSLLGARAMPAGSYPAVLAPRAAAGLISVLAPAVCGDAVAKGRSWLAGMAGKKIASEIVNVVDDGLLEQGPGAFPFDDEGVVCRRTPVITGGVLEGFLYDTYYGARAGGSSSANGIRPGYHMPPGIDTNNWVLLPGGGTEDELIGQVDDGILIVEFLGLHTADAVAGEFSLGAQGFRIESGRIAEPVSGIAIAGTLAEFLDRVEALSDTLKFTGDTGAPAVLIGKLDVSG